MTEPVNNKCTEHIKHNYNCKKCVGVKKPFLPIPNNEWLKPLMKEMGEKIVKGIYISVATDNDYDTQPLEDWLESAILSKLESIEQEAELYGRLHETIEMFQSGTIASYKYSQRHAELTEQISQLKLGVTT